MSHLLLCSIVLQNIQIFYSGSVIFIVTCFLSQPDCRNVLPEHCNVIIKQQLCGEELSSFCLCSKLILFKRSRLYCSKSSYTYQTSQKKSVSGLVIQIIPPKVLQECTTILQLKFYMAYMVQKLVVYPP